MVPDDAAAVAELRGQLAWLREQLAVVVTALAQRDVVIAELRAENAELRRQLGSNSRNSSKPPSTESGRSRRRSRCAAALAVGPAVSRVIRGRGWHPKRATTDQPGTTGQVVPSLATGWSP